MKIFIIPLKYTKGLSNKHQNNKLNELSTKFDQTFMKTVLINVKTLCVHFKFHPSPANFTQALLAKLVTLKNVLIYHSIVRRTFFPPWLLLWRHDTIDIKYAP